QTHGVDVDVAHVGARAAINVSGVEVDDVVRGDILAQPGYFNTTYMIDARLHMLPDAPTRVTNRTRVHLHLGPREVLARVVLLEGEELLPGDSQLVQLRLEEPGVAARGDRFVIRRYSPVQTLGGGVVLDAQPVKHRRFRDDVIQSLRDLEQDDPTQVLKARLKSAGLQPKTAADLASEMALSVGDIETRLNDLVSSEEAITYMMASKAVFAHAECWAQLLDGIAGAMAQFHKTHPLRPGARRDELRALVPGRPSDGFFAYGVEHLMKTSVLKSEEALIRLSDYEIELTVEQEHVRGAIVELLQTGGTAPKDLKELPDAIGCDVTVAQDVVLAMQATGGLVRMDDTLLFHPEVIVNVEQKLIAHLEENGEVDVSTFRDLVGTTRKFAVPLLNYFDTKGTTIRQGDVRVLGK
ncbi:MAG: SelB C-terminal domain-containing protein, partial [Candidatus Latescibacteria bacterium]|nr:SelB C-terminal domain-containing protein [Candidatus Latescibacterota bacterium]